MKDKYIELRKQYVNNIGLGNQLGLHSRVENKRLDT